jgi:hypothetical protein
VPARLGGDAELRRGRAHERELAMVGVAGPGVFQPAHVDARAARGIEDPCLDGRARTGGGRAQLEARAAADLVERQGERDVLEPSGAAQAPDERGRAEVIRLARVGPLLGAGRDEPDVAGGRRAALQRCGERDERADAGGVVVGAGGRRHAIGVGHGDDEAVGRRVADADDVARAAVAGHREALVADAQAGRPEALRDALVGSALGGRAGGARAGARERRREVVGCGRGRRGGGGRERAADRRARQHGRRAYCAARAKRPASSRTRSTSSGGSATVKSTPISAM